MKNAKQNNDHSTGGGHGTFTRRNARRHEAEARQIERDERTPQEQIALLNQRGFKAVRERARLVKQIAKKR